MSRNGVPLYTKLASRLVGFYRTWSPIERGKWWLLRHTSFFLIAPLGEGLWIRATGVSGFEWKALLGRPGEEATASLFSRLLQPGMTVFDVGSNIGYYTLLAARAVGPEGQVHAFEATPAVAKRLAENVALNRFANVTVNHLAVCDREGDVEFNLQEDSEGNSMVVSDPGHASVSVPATTLDAYVSRQGISRVDLIKIDVEGVEGLVLEGARTLLGGTQPPVLIIESNPATLRAAGNSPEQLCDRLASFGYRCFGIEQLLPEPDSVWNILAIHSTHPTAEIAAGLEPFPGKRA